MNNINVTRQDALLIIELARADKKNALTRQMYQQMALALERAGQDSDVAAVVIKGQGDCFTAGNDLADFAANQDGDHVAETVYFMQALMACPLPVIAQVHGLVVGIGTTMLLHCDLVYCAEESRFILPFINLGLVPEFASSYLLPKLVGHHKACEWLMLGEPFSALEAYHFGLVNEVLAPEKLEQKVLSVAKKLCDKPRRAMAHTKALLKNQQNRTQMQMNEELDLFVQCLKSTAAQEAFDAFLQKRPVDKTKFN